MYNRVLKRPMFRIGGQAGQGTGIMSHVEPKPTYAIGGRIMAQGGYDPRGTYFGYGPDPRGTYFGPSSTAPVSETPVMFDPYAPTGAATEAEKISSFENSYEKARQKRLEQFEKIRKYGPKAVAAAEAAAGTAAGYTGILGPAVAGLGLGYGKRRLTDYLISDIEKRKTGIDNKKTANYKETNPAGSLLAYKNLTSPGTITTAIDENGNLIDRATGQLLDREPGDTDKTTSAPVKPIPKDPKQQIKEEADFIRDLVKDEDMTTAEAAFVVAKALATPGGIGEKVRAANELLIPMAKEKSKTKKDITLEAYKAYKDKQLEEIKAGKLSDWGKAVREAAENAKRAGDKRPIEEIIKDYNDLKFGEEKFMDKIIAGKLQNDVITIDNKIRSNEEYEYKIANKEKVSKDETKMYEQNKRLIQKFKLTNPELFKKIAPNYVEAKDGGRIGFAYGSPEPEQQPQVESTPLNQGDNQVQLKPVIKLSYQELRTRLPKEISDNIVLLLSNSDQALQDFAYITTQQDINDFNVKYGVNLVLPSNK